MSPFVVIQTCNLIKYISLQNPVNQKVTEVKSMVLVDGYLFAGDDAGNVSLFFILVMNLENRVIEYLTD